MEQEIWKDIPGYEGLYQASNLGNIKSLSYKGGNKEKVLKPQTHRLGYKNLQLTGRKTYFTHRLIAITFLPNPLNKEEVNHINGIKSDNRVENLEWVTHGENIKHSVLFLARHNSLKGLFGKLNYNSKKTLQLDLEGNLLRKWDSLMDIQRELGFKNSTLSKCCLGQIRTAYGFIWKYE